MEHRLKMLVGRYRAPLARALAWCCAVVLLVGSLSITQGNLTPQWTQPHCPQGQTHGAQHNHNHCAWHCGGLDIQGCGGQGEISADGLVSRVWSLDDIPLRDAGPGGEFPPRGPPRVILQIA